MLFIYDDIIHGQNLEDLHLYMLIADTFLKSSRLTSVSLNFTQLFQLIQH
ncbi:hypothetical protein AM1_0252 [Acaryochloris marina MBIC11017]|uniref:Uncharacterized protein n=1 Tax=Acaryochloris marina (strain MBIC 11017) TaxID=329726 RepID=B0C8U8_ACAM1|nr:hypothetical protein AM1_0252 [Acaryochloris marina MBIC11017]